MKWSNWSIVLASVAAAVVLFAAGAVYLRVSSDADTEPSRCVVVFAAPGEDATEIAQLVVVVDMATGSYEIEDANQAATIPGTSYTKLRDAYPFGGAEVIAAVLDGGVVKPETAWVGISESGWQGLLVNGVDVTIKESFETFDDVSEIYTEFLEGPGRIPATDLRALVNGAPYLSPDAQETIFEALASASLQALASSKPGPEIETSLTQEQWDAFVTNIRGAQ